MNIQENIYLKELSDTSSHTNLKTDRVGILLIHGMTGTPIEMRPLAKHLKNLGYSKVEIPILAGHGQGHKELLATTWQDWLLGLRKVVNEMSAECDQIFIAGLSVGGLLGILLTIDNPKISGLALLSVAYGTPSRDTPKLRILLPLAFKFPFMRRYFFWTEKPPYGIKDKRLQQNITRTIKASKRGETTQHGLFRTYVESLYQHRLLEEEVRRKAIKVTCPILIMHSFEDTMLSIENAISIYKDLGTNEKVVKFITGCDHVMTVDLRKQEVAKEVGLFINKLADVQSKETKGFQDDLTCEIYPNINSLDLINWEKLFPNLPDTNEMIKLTQSPGIDGFSFHNIVVQKGHRPILFLPIFETNFNISSFLNKKIKKIADSIIFMFPKIFCPRILGVGFVEAEWGQVGIDPLSDQETLSSAWDMALDALDALQNKLEANVITFVNFTSESGKLIPMNKLAGFTEIASSPYGQLSINFESVEGYINSLSSNTRKDLHKKIKKASNIKIFHTQEVDQYIKTIYKLYLDTAKKSGFVHGIQSQNYFESICKKVKEAKYILYFVDGKLAAFRLVIEKPGCLVDKYFGMDSALGSKYSLYHISHLENVRYCIEKKIPLYHAGQAAEEILASLGAKLIPSLILFKHTSPVIHSFLTLLSKYFSHRLKIVLPKARLGRDLEGNTSA